MPASPSSSLSIAICSAPRRSAFASSTCPRLKATADFPRSAIASARGYAWASAMSRANSARSAASSRSARNQWARPRPAASIARSSSGSSSADDRKRPFHSCECLTAPLRERIDLPEPDERAGPPRACRPAPRRERSIPRAGGARCRGRPSAATSRRPPGAVQPAARSRRPARPPARSSVWPRPPRRAPPRARRLASSIAQALALISAASSAASGAAS